MEELNVGNEQEWSTEESETDTREQRFKENYKAALVEGCEKSSSSSNESLRHECPELYNYYKAKVMQHLECLDGGITQVQIDAFRDNRSSLTIRELDRDASLELGHCKRMGDDSAEWCGGVDTLCDVHDERSVIAQDEELNRRVSSNFTDESSGNTSSNSTDKLNGLVSSNSTEESNEQTSSNSTDESTGPTSSNSTSSVDEEAPEYLANHTLPIYVEINKRTCNNNNASVFEEMGPDVALSKNKETNEQMPANAPLIHEGTGGYVHSNIPSNCEEIVAWHLPDYARSGKEEMDGRVSSSLNADADYVLTGNEEVVGHLCSSLNNGEIHKPMPDCVPTADQEIADYLSSSLNNTERYESMPDYAHPGNEEMVECFSRSLNKADIHTPMPDIARTGDKEMIGHLSSSLNNADMYTPMADYALTGNKEMSRSMEVDGHHESILDYTSINDQTGGFVPSCNLSPGLNKLNYTPMKDQSCERVPKRNPSGPNQDVYKPTVLDYAPTNNKMNGHLPYRSASTINERLSARRRDELRRASLLKKEEFGHTAEQGVFTDYSKDGRRPQPPGSRSLEDLRPLAPPAVRPPPPKVSFFSFEQELSRCENALREAKAELREERKKQVVVDTFRMNLLEVDRMCSEEMCRLREEAARLEPLNQIAAEWERDSRQTFMYNQYPYSRGQRQSVGSDCFVKSYVRRLGDPETYQTGEVRPPTF